jgi:hypothetical protein
MTRTGTSFLEKLSEFGCRNLKRGKGRNDELLSLWG